MAKNIDLRVAACDGNLLEVLTCLKQGDDVNLRDEVIQLFSLYIDKFIFPSILILV